MKGRKIRLIENIQRATLKVMLRTEGFKKKSFEFRINSV